MFRAAMVATAVCGAVAFTSHASAAISYSTLGEVYTQDFDSLPVSPTNSSLGNSPIGWIDDSTSPGENQFSIPGFYLFHAQTQTEGGANGNQRLRIGAGTANTGSFWSYGAAESSDRALGALGSATMHNSSQPNMLIGLRLVNDTGQTLTNFSVTYDGEQWRGSIADPSVLETLSFAYSLTADDTTWTSTETSFAAVAELDFTATVGRAGATNANALVDGNGEGLVADITGSVHGISWLPGAELWLRWSDPSGAAASQNGLAIDNLRFSANVPEPTTLALLGIAALAFAARRRVR